MSVHFPSTWQAVLSHSPDMTILHVIYVYYVINNDVTCHEACCLLPVFKAVYLILSTSLMSLTFKTFLLPVLWSCSFGLSVMIKKPCHQFCTGLYRSCPQMSQGRVMESIHDICPSLVGMFWQYIMDPKTEYEIMTFQGLVHFLGNTC